MPILSTLSSEASVVKEDNRSDIESQSIKSTPNENITREMVFCEVSDAIKDVFNTNRDFYSFDSYRLKDIHLNSRLLEDLDFDSLDFINFNLTLEERVAHDLEMDECFQKQKFKTVGDVVEFVFLTLKGENIPTTPVITKHRSVLGKIADTVMLKKRED